MKEHTSFKIDVDFLSPEDIDFSNSIDLLEDIEKEEKVRREKKRTLSYGIQFLDDALGGITKGDLIVLSSKTGRGKTQLATIIAETNIRKGFKGLYIGLEADDHEIGQRIKFRNMMKLNWKDHYQEGDFEGIKKYYVSFDKWRKGKAKWLDDTYTDRVITEFATIKGRLKIKYKHINYTIDDLEQDMLNSKDVDFIILDHLNYIDIIEPNENIGLKRIIKVIRTNNLNSRIPIIVIAHQRKTERKSREIVGDIEDIYGSSDVIKIATHIILFNAEIEGIKDYFMYETYFKIAKNRFDSSSTRYIAKLVYNGFTNDYMKPYELGYNRPFAQVFEPIDDKTKLPLWYRYREDFTDLF